MTSTITPVILCGGSGTRLWPLSRELHPKQFVTFGQSSSLFARTLRRVREIPDIADPLIVCNEEHRFQVRNELRREWDAQASILLEPAPRNTAPAVALAALALLEKDQDSLMLVLPSDHALGDTAAFCKGVLQAAPLAENGSIVTFGITPDGPETGYGYIERGDSLGPGFTVARFVEKPDLATAQTMLAQGNFFWNSGIFLLRASVFWEELTRHAPRIAAGCRKAWEARQYDDAFCRPGCEAFLAIPGDSIDYAIMEKTSRAAVVPLTVQWSDLGSWESLYQEGEKDSHKNAITGDVIAEDTEGCYLNAQHRLLAALGVRDLVIVETQDAVLVVPRQRAQEVKKIVARLQREQRKECQQHTLVQRPWGSFEALASGDRFQVKRIIVRPGAELSLQMHHHRAEHWVVVSGTAEITNGQETRLFTEDQSTYIPIGTQHRLKNPGKIPLVLIEIQSGAYLGEDDIVRFADVYGRN
ncbi:mannose-1-phosphate guanylyltransferase/mannose-6-phosphate isomerase [Desulfovibrio piger]|nr:mannose-1-phosphate guanylyltransferase/mannose-6-phosphate isomerase [Desulfovibrio piger]